MQQLTQNNLTSPLTLGTSSGAWLALVVVNIWFVDWVADYSALAAMVGALVAFGLIVSIAGVRNMTGLPLVVSGMVINTFKELPISRWKVAILAVYFMLIYLVLCVAAVKLGFDKLPTA